MSRPATALRRNQQATLRRNHASPTASPTPDPIDVAKFEATMTAWFATALEITKSIFTLASAGFGLTVNLQFGDKALGEWPAVWLMLSAFTFGCSSVVCIAIFVNNKALALANLNNTDGKNQPAVDRHDGIAGCLDWTSRLTFCAGLLFSFLAVVAKVYLSEVGAK